MGDLEFADGCKSFQFLLVIVPSSSSTVYERWSLEVATMLPPACHRFVRGSWTWIVGSSLASVLKDFLAVSSVCRRLAAAVWRSTKLEVQGVDWPNLCRKPNNISAGDGESAHGVFLHCRSANL